MPCTPEYSVCHRLLTCCYVQGTDKDKAAQAAKIYYEKLNQNYRSWRETEEKARIESLDGTAPFPGWAPDDEDKGVRGFFKLALKCFWA